MRLLVETWSVAWKEWHDAVRDRRALFAALAYAAFGPLVLGLVISALARQETREPDRRVSVVGGDPPRLVEALSRAGVVPSDAAPVVLHVPEDYEDAVGAGRPVRLTIRADLAEYQAEVDALVGAIDEIGAEVARQRLLARGLSPAVTQPLRAGLEDTSGLSRRGRAISTMLLLFLILAPFFSSTSVAIDATSGERERGSLEPLLALPVSRVAIVAGKWLVTALAALAGTALSVAVGAFAINRAPLGDLGVRLHLEASVAAAALACLLPLVGLVAAVQLLVALAAPSFKEGQTYLTLLSFLPALVGLSLAQTGAHRGARWPLLWEMDALERVIWGGGVPLASLTATAFAYALFVTACLLVASRQLGRERLLASS